MLKRTLTGAVIVAVTVGFFFLRTIDIRLFLILIAGISIIAAVEINIALGEKTGLHQKILCVSAVVFANVFGAIFDAAGLFVPYAVFACILLVLPVFSGGKRSLESVTYSVFALIYPAVLLIPLTLINNLGNVSFFALVLTFVVSPCADVFAYLVGRTFKGKKLCPDISPNKTISGAIGGLIGGMVGAIVVYAILKDSFVYHLSTNPYVYFGIVGLLAAALTEIGDLVESFIKRSVGIKDSGKIFPGHGGMLDRIDGLIFASVFIYFVSALL